MTLPAYKNIELTPNMGLGYGGRLAMLLPQPMISKLSMRGLSGWRLRKILDTPPTTNSEVSLNEKQKKI